MRIFSDKKSGKNERVAFAQSRPASSTVPRVRRGAVPDRLGQVRAARGGPDGLAHESDAQGEGTGWAVRGALEQPL